MSIKDQIADHPDVAGHENEALTTAVRHLMYCAEIAASCADACIAEPGDRVQCIRLCLDTSDVCGMAARVAARRAGANEALIRGALDLARQACEASAAECERHESDHCARCAKMCREVIEDIGKVTL